MKTMEEFMWAGGFENTFIPQSRPGLRPLEEYELTQHYEQWRSDLDRAASLGISTLRWGIPWYRVEPQPGTFDWAWIDDVLNYMVEELHIQPIVDLIHYGTPLWLEESFAAAEYPERVAAYAYAFAQRYRKLVHFYTPLNEPAVNADFCGRQGLWPPYLTGEKGYLEVMLALAKGIQLTAQAIHAADPDAELVAVEAMNWTQAATSQAEEAARGQDIQNFLCWDLVTGNVKPSHPLYRKLVAAGITEHTLENLCAHTINYDIFGVNFYPWSAQTITIGDSGELIYDIVPRNGLLLADVLHRCYTYTQLPLMITETSAREDVSGRQAWMDETIAAVHKVQAEGVPVCGYTWFPLITMIDWEYRRSTKPVSDYLLHLGLWDAQLDEHGKLIRQETPLAAQYRAYATNER